MVRWWEVEDAFRGLSDEDQRLSIASVLIDRSESVTIATYKMANFILSFTLYLRYAEG